ncbi:sensor histidine kinase [Undibacterium jejuense]|nr:histidine kinase [Undibacterium jejuense]
MNAVPEVAVPQQILGYVSLLNDALTCYLAPLLYYSKMKTEPKIVTNSQLTNWSYWQKLAQILALNFAAWLVFTAIGALTSYNDDLRSGFLPDYWEIFKDWGRSAIALCILSFILYAVFSRFPDWICNGKRIILSYGLLLLSFLPLNLFFVLKLFLSDGNQQITWETIQTHITALDDYSSLLRLSSVTAVFFAVVIVKNWQRTQLREKILEQERISNLHLRLELEQQKLSALRAQLEPHFMFNALNAISALVLTDSKEKALNGIQGLSELLRYALDAAEKDSVQFSDELAFLQDYIGLQKLRYGSRLQLTITGIDDVINNAECPPLLLQLLLENALRHDLDCHQGASDILIEFSHTETHIEIYISNPLHDLDGTTSINQGAGLGLRNISARLDLLYGGQASIETQRINKRFEVNLRLPRFLNR